MEEEEGPTECALMAFSDSEVYNINSCSNSCPALKEYEALKVKYNCQRIEINDVNFSLANHKRGLGVLEEQLTFIDRMNQTLLRI